MPARRSTVSLSIPLPYAESRGLTMMQALDAAEDFVRSKLGPEERIVGDPAFEELEVPAAWGGPEWRWTWIVETLEGSAPG
jgi:hypothetical protein